MKTKLSVWAAMLMVPVALTWAEDKSPASDETTKILVKVDAAAKAVKAVKYDVVAKGSGGGQGFELKGTYTFTGLDEIVTGTAVTATYSGSKGVHLARLSDVNVPTGVIQADGRRFFPGCSGRGCTPPPESRRHNPAFGAIQGRNWDGDSSYHGLSLGLKRRFSTGFSYQFSYTFQKFLDNGSGYTGSPGDFVTGNTLVSHWLDSSMDKGPSAWNTPQTFSANFSWDLPFGPGRTYGSGTSGFMGGLIEGWQINGLARLADGPAVEVNVTGRRFTCSVCDSRPDLIPGKDNSPNIGDPNQWFGDVLRPPSECPLSGGKRTCKNKGRRKIQGPRPRPRPKV